MVGPMKTYIALFRGINVGGNAVLPMKELAALLGTLGAQEVKTYIQSGNAVFRMRDKDPRALSKRISAAIKKSHGFEPQVFLLELGELENAMAANPFPEAESEPKTLHVNFLASVPEKPGLKALERVRADRERFVVKGRIFYLHAPDGIGRSKLAANAESLLGVSMTSRNWRTVRTMMEMAKEYEG